MMNRYVNIDSSTKRTLLKWLERGWIDSEELNALTGSSPMCWDLVDRLGACRECVRRMPDTNIEGL